MAANPLSELDVLADQIARSRHVVESATKDRDALIVAALDQGYTEREIALAAGVTNVRVHQIKKEATA